MNIPLFDLTNHCYVHYLQIFLVLWANFVKGPAVGGRLGAKMLIFLVIKCKDNSPKPSTVIKALSLAELASIFKNCTFHAPNLRTEIYLQLFKVIKQLPSITPTSNAVRNRLSPRHNLFSLTIFSVIIVHY